MGVVGHTILYGPLLDAGCHGVGDGTVEACAIVNHVDQFLVDILGQILVHLLSVEDIFAEILVGTFFGSLYFEWLLLESLLYNLKS